MSDPTREACSARLLSSPRNAISAKHHNDKQGAA